MTKVLHLWKGDSPSVGGGGAGSMYRLHSNLRNAGINSRILCELKTSNSPYVDVKPLPSRIEGILRRFTSAAGLNDIHRISSWKLLKHPSFKEADIINFHGIHSEFLSYLALPKITAAKPTIFTLRDMWALTGHCAFFFDCERWKTGCGNCPGLHYYPPVKRDATKLEWKLKNWVYEHSNLTLVALSQWVADRARQGMLKRFPIHVIPNGIDTEALTPLDPESCKYALGIPPRKRVIMFAANSLSSIQKGGDLVLKILESLPRTLKSEIVFLTFGRKGEQLTDSLDMQTIHLDYVGSARLKGIAFSAADIFLFPSRAETFGQVILESFACGTPVVSHSVGPLGDLIRHDYTGYMAEAENTKEMAEGILKLLDDDKLRTQMGENCRKIAVEEYSLELEVQRYISLYKSVLQKN